MSCNSNVTIKTFGMANIATGRGSIRAVFGPPANNADDTELFNSYTEWGGGMPVNGDFSRLVLELYASHASKADGLKFYFSADGTNWDLFASYTLPAAASPIVPYDVPVLAPYVKVTYSNTAADLTAWRGALIGVPKDRAVSA